jgi:hypothetical protein
MKRRFKFAPLSGAYMATSMIGVLISLMYVYPSSYTWGITATFVFAIMFVASLISMTTADPDEFIEMETKKKKKDA